MTVRAQMCGALVMVWLLPSFKAVAQDQERSVRDGVYTEAQARRGETIYLAECSRCHGDRLAGTESSPPLTGDTFAMAWDGRTLAELFEVISTTMPQDGPGRLSPEQVADILAHLLAAGVYANGSHDLPADVVRLKRIRFQRPAER